MNWKLHSPGRYALVGPSHSGKSELVLKIISNPTIWNDRPAEIIYAAPKLNDRQNYLERLERACQSTKGAFRCIDSLPDDFGAVSGYRKSLLIIDDVMAFSKEELKKIVNLMIMDSHHYDVTVLVCQQSPFPPGQEFVTCNRNLTGRFLTFQLNDW